MEGKQNRAGEMIRFALTGGVCFLVELGVLILLKGGLGLDTLIATPIAFLVSVILNYLLCVVWVFKGVENKGTAAKAGFLITSLIGGLSMYDIPKMLNNGNPNNSTLTATMFIYNQSFQNSYMYARGAAASMILFLIIAFFSAIIFFMMRDRK